MQSLDSKVSKISSKKVMLGGEELARSQKAFDKNEMESS